MYVTYSEGGEWEPLHLSGTSLAEMKQRGEWLGRKLYAIKYPDGKVYDYTLQRYRTKEGH